MSSQNEKISAIKQCLQPIIGQEVADDIVDYILTFNQEEDYHDFMESMVNEANPEHVRLCEQLQKKLFGAKKKKSAKQTSYCNQQAQNNVNKANLEASSGSSSASNYKGRKIKYASFNTYENKSFQKKGRHPCECQATRHELVNNCTKCGRIVCEQEGSGPCLFCDNMVCTRAEIELLVANTKGSDRLYNHLMEQKTSKEWKKAVESRNKLLQVDQQSSVRNKVIDDQNDYFDLNSKWTSDAAKAESKKLFRSKYEYLHKSKREFKLALDFASRTVALEDGQASNKKHLLKGVNKLLDNDKRFPKNLFSSEKSQLMSDIVKLMEESSMTHKGTLSSTNKNETTGKFVVANDDLLESIDQGVCLSMHQPWASLLVAGIKIHEGRTWKTEHRGKLWIAAASKEPDDEEILACEEMYRILYNDPTIEFPKKYPTKCLLGCVFIEDCLDQDAYRQKYGEGGESSSPFVLICSNPVILPIFYPMQGQHKIFRLEKELHRSAKAALMSSKWV